MKRLCLLTILLTILLSGCSEFQRADSDARNTAKATLGQVLELKRQVRKKIAAEERYYCRTMQTVVDKRTRTQEVAFMRGTALAVDEEAMGIREDPNSLTAESLSTRLAAHADAAADEAQLPSARGELGQPDGERNQAAGCARSERKIAPGTEECRTGVDHARANPSGADHPSRQARSDRSRECIHYQGSGTLPGA